MDPQAVLGLAVALQIRSAIAVITLGTRLRRRPRENMQKRSKLL